MGYSERTACRVLGLDRSTYYDIKYHTPSDREIRHLLLTDAIADVHERSRKTYGMLRVKATLEIEQGLIVNRKLILKIMRELQIQGLPGPKKTRRNLVNVATHEDLVQRNFTATRANALWLTESPNTPPARARSTAAWCWTSSAARWWARPSTDAVRRHW